jgi:benzylsuccinate CoA-transferase BbsE subunit
MLYAAEAGVGTGWTRLVDWLIEANAPGAGMLKGADWLTNQFKARADSTARFADIFGAFARTQTKQQIFEEGQRRRISITPVNDGAEVCEDRHVKAVDGLQAVSAVAGRTIIGPHVPVVMSRTPLSVQGPAPLLGAGVHARAQRVGA